MTDNIKEFDDKYGELHEKLVKQYSEADVKAIDKAYEVAKKAHSKQKRYSGEPYIMHPVAVADILLGLGMDAESLEAALLHDTVEDTDINLDYIRQEFGDEIANLVDGVTKLGKVPLSTWEERQAENIRKMLLAMSEDIRVIIIKLADRLHNMRTLEHMREQKRRDKALETLEIYAPIAHRLGIRTIKEELEDLSIKYLDPIAYKEINDMLEATKEKHKDFLPSVIDKIKTKVTETNGGVYVDGRIKSTHGIYRKMYMQNKDYDEIFDIFAVRIIVDSVIDCYNCLGIIHEMFHPLPNRFKDYISMPKPNMYQSLHTTVIDQGIPFEVQIRTWEMHYTAEYGIAAHWKYKLGQTDGGIDKFNERLSWIRKLLNEQNESGDAEEIIRALKTDFVSGDVYVFTPKGDVVTVPRGATVIDFAYTIHSAVGNKMIGAKVNGRIVPLDYKVNTGEIVEVLTSSQPGKGPSRDWLKIVTTTSARNKIRSWFKKEKRPENIEEGKAEIDYQLRRNNIRLYDNELDDFLNKLSEKQKCNNLDDFFAAIGYGSISVDRLMPYMKEEYAKILKSSKEPEINLVKEKTNVSSGGGVVVEGIDNCLIKFSHCCNPLPGDDIIGFITRGHGVSIHKRDCVNVPLRIEDAQEPGRWIKVYWDNEAKVEYRSTLSIYCDTRLGLLADITSMLAAMHVMIHNISSRENKDGQMVISLTITVNGVDHLNTVISKISSIDGVTSVERSII